MHPAVFDDECEQLISLYETLLDDVSVCMKQEDSPANRRSFVRAVFAFVEGCTFRFKLLALSFETRRNNSLSVGEISVLSGQAFSVDDNGNVRVRRLQISPSANLQLATRLAARCFDVDTPKPAESKVGWNRFHKAVKLRNRITHPNTASELAVSEAELQLVNHAFRWSVSILALLLVATLEKLVSELGSVSGGRSSREINTKLDEIRQRYTEAMSNVISWRDA
ncbi:MAG: hypothetical protein QOC70_723 [Verrucomicrobiota bacterium]|jgi:hypothetical protein